MHISLILICNYYVLFLGFIRCIGWKVQKNAPNKRTCRHLRDYLGDEFEKNRIGKLPADKKVAPEPSQRFSHISISLLLANKYDEK